MDLQTSFSAGKIDKFPTKSILGYPPHLKYVAALPWKNKNQKFCTIHAHKTCFRSDFLSSIQQISVKCHKISAKINNVQNINILLFCLFTVLNRLKALQLSKVCLWSDFWQDIIDTAVDQWRKHLQACVRANVGHFDHLLWKKTCKQFAIFHVFLV